MDRLQTSPQPRQRLTEARMLQRWSQQEVAKRIGTTHVNISRWERGLTKPGSYFRRKLCLLFGKSEQELDLELPRVEATIGTSSVPSSNSISSLYDPAIPRSSAPRLVGRDGVLARLRQRLCEGRAHNIALTALNGLPGVGKTALSLALAHDTEVREHFRDGILWAGLGPNPNLLGVLSRWGTLLGVSLTETGTSSDNEAWTTALRAAIGSRSMLLVIDDAWRIEEALALSIGGPNCAHLVTTRFPTIATQVAADGATMLHELSESESIALLKMLAPSVIDHELKRATDLIHTVGGLPLALTLMGNYLRIQAHDGQPRRIRAAIERLNDAEERLQISEPRGPTDRHTSLSPDTALSLQSVISVTDEQLDKQTSTALYALSVFPPKPDNFSEEAALVVTMSSVDVLDTLTDTGLLESSSPGRYTLHQTIADYARTRLKDIGETAAYDRLITYSISYIQAHKKDYELLEQESSILLAALNASYDQGKQDALIRSVCAFAPFLLLRGFYPLAERHLQRAHEAAIAMDDYNGITSTLLYLGEIAQKQGNYVLAASHFQQGLALARQIQNNERITALLNDLGWVTWKQGNYTQAETHLQEGLALARHTGDQERLCSILKTLGSVVGSQGNYAQETKYQQEGLTIARQLGDREQICILLINLGVTEGERGHYVEAEEKFQEGLMLAREIGHREWISALLSNLGEAASEQGHYVQAQEYFQEGLVLARQIGHLEWVSHLLSNMGLTIRKQGHYTQAERYFEESLVLARQIGPQMTANALYEYGNLYLDQQQIASAEATFREMLTTIPEGGQDLLALAQYGLARTIATQGNFHEAQKFGEASATVLEAIGHRKAQEVRNWLNIVTG